MKPFQEPVEQGPKDTKLHVRLSIPSCSSPNHSKGPGGLLPVGLPAASVASESLSRLPERHRAFTDFCLCRAFGGIRIELRIDCAT